jgi:transposase
MHKITLTEQEKTALEIRHRATKDVCELDRIKAILLRSEGWSIRDIAQALRVHEGTITRHLKEYLEETKLSFSKGGSCSSLDESQTEELIAHLEENTYQSTQEIILYVEDNYGITYSVPGFNKWLHRNGFSYKKPKGRPYKACPIEQEKFIKNYNILKKHLPKDEGILFMDSSHPSMGTKITYGWIRTGKEKAIETSASRTRINLVGAINLEALSKPIICNYSTVDSDVIVDFLGQIRKHANISGKIHLILDQAGYHSNDKVLKAAKTYNIQLHFLPPYSPNLNPIERLWKLMNEYARNNIFFKTVQDFRSSIANFFSNTLAGLGSILENRINDNFEKLNQAY